MLDKDIVKENYRRLSTFELIDLSKKPQELRAEIHAILRNELLERNEIKAVESWDNLLLNGTEKKSLRSENQETLFKEIEEKGGFITQLIEGTIQRKIAESAQKEQELFDSGKETLLGT